MRLVTILLALAPVIAWWGTPAAAQGPAAACLFEHANFQGRRTCFAAGQRVPMVDGSMNDKYSSVQLPPGLRITLCEHANFAGRCVPVDRSIGNLNEIGFNDRVSSVSVEFDRAGPPGRQFDGPGRPRDYDGPPPRRAYDDARSDMYELRVACDAGDRRACIRFGIAIGRNWERRERWRQESPEFFTWER